MASIHYTFPNDYVHRIPVLFSISSFLVQGTSEQLSGIAVAHCMIDPFVTGRPKHRKGPKRTDKDRTGPERTDKDRKGTENGRK